MIGQTISHYRITEKLGEGGMGVVYKAEDTSLDRPVALKFLAAHLVSDGDIRKRFEREAKAAAALSHPNICTVYEITEDNARTFIAMAFLEGEGLDKTIEAGPLKLKDALDIAIQTAQGLHAAHEKGIVHRDIKPANLMVTGTGSKQHVTIMDFGLAQLADRSKLTRMDETMGTVTYMSPEQTYGTDLDHRSDIWSLGVVIYEMVTGQQPFKGHYDKAVMYSITNEDPEPITGLRTGVPMELEWLVNKCLAKDPDERYQTTADMVVDLETLKKKFESGKSTIMSAAPSPSVVSRQAVSDDSGTEASEHPLVKYRVIEDIKESDDSIKYVAEDTQLRRSVAIRVLPQSSAERIERAQRRKQTVAFGVGALGLLLSVIIAFSAWFAPAPVTDTPLRRFTITPPVPLLNFTQGSGKPYDNFVAISPNAKHIAFIEGGDDERRLWIQDLNQLEPRVMEGTEGAIDPFWSPDSDYVGFATGGVVKKISVRGGRASRVCELPGSHFHGGTWSPDREVIVFSSGDLLQPHSLYQVAARGGTATALLTPDDLADHSGGERMSPAWAHFLPAEAGPRVLLFAHGNVEDQDVFVQDLVTGDRAFLGPGAFPIYSQSGHLLYQTRTRSNDLWALPFSLETLKAEGEAFPVAENLRDASVALDGTLVYVEPSYFLSEKQPVWLDREGNKIEEIGQPRESFRYPALSPDGGRVAATVGVGPTSNIWVEDLSRGTRTRVSASSELDTFPVWSPAGDQLAYTSLRSGNFDVYLRQADGSGVEQKVAVTPANEMMSDWSRDGRYLLGNLLESETGRDLWYFEQAEGDSGWKPHPFLQEPLEQRGPKLSPDGRYVAYLSRESGQSEVYVVPFPEAGRRVTISNNGGTQVRWSPNGHELFYVQGRTTLMAVAVSTEGEFTAGSPEPLFEHSALEAVRSTANYDVSLDGQRFIVPEQVGGVSGEAAGPKIHVVENWYEEFRDREQD